jgi:hypothetical protein
LPWLRTGIATKISNNEDELSTSRAAIPIRLNVRINDDPNNIRPVTLNSNPDHAIFIYGPGDIVGIIKNTVIRTTPNHNESNFQDNYFVHIEFSQPDFPWRFTPAKYKTGSRKDRLSPWICLIVLGDDEFEPLQSETGDTFSNKIAIRSPQTSLPDLNQSWCWAHCQIMDDDGRIRNNKIELANILERQPHRVISRIICPRRLEPKTKYHAFLVPSFKVGALAGLGHMDIVDTIRGTEFAWNVQESQQPIELPIYYQWEFSTGEKGDFEALASLLEAETLSDTIGLRKVDVSKPLPIITGISKPLSLGGSLWSPAAENNYKNKERIDVRAPRSEEIRILLMQLRELLDSNERRNWIVSSDSEWTDPLVVPPIYGKYHVEKPFISKISTDYQEPDWIRNIVNMQPILSSDPVIRSRSNYIIEQIKKIRDNPPFLWLEELNLDISNRIAAGLGSLVIQQLQEELMASAWDQAYQQNLANRLNRLAQFGLSISDNIFTKNIEQKLDDSNQNDNYTLLNLTAALHNSIPLTIGDQTKIMSSFIDDSGISSSAISSRAFKILTSRQNKIHRMVFDGNEEEDSINYFQAARDIFPRSATTEDLITIDKILPDVLDPEQQLFDSNNNLEFFIPQETLNIEVEPIPFLSDTNTLSGQIRDMSFQIRQILKPSFTIKAKISEKIQRPSINTNQDSATTTPVGEKSPDNILLDPVLFYPKFKRPMFEPLKDISQEFILPGAENIGENKIGILKINTAFINSYMVGLNHEMARELLWREYPTDLRGTFFRQFWDPSMAIEIKRAKEIMQITGSNNNYNDYPFNRDQEERIAEEFFDIKEIHKWKTDLHLLDIQNNVSDNKTFLLIKGELLRRYPTAIIYASRAVWYNARPTLPSKITAISIQEQIKEPIFIGTLEPNTTFFGFDISEKELKGITDPFEGAVPGVDGSFDNAGWFFVIQEQPSEPSFGFDINTKLSPQGTIENWDDLGWDYTDANRSPPLIIPMIGTSNSNYVNLLNQSANGIKFSENSELRDPLIPDKGKNIDNIEWSSNAAAMAYISLQKPFRMAIHAEVMLDYKSN